MISTRILIALTGLVTVAAVVAGLLPWRTETTSAGVPILYGDVNCEGTVNSIDAALVLQYDAGLIASLACQDGADVNGDGAINSVDAALILQYGAGLIDRLGPPQPATPMSTATATGTLTPTPTAIPSPTVTPTPASTATRLPPPSPTTATQPSPVPAATVTQPPASAPTATNTAESEDDFGLGMVDGCYQALLDWTDLSPAEGSAFCEENVGDQESIHIFRDLAAALVPPEEITYDLGFCMGFTSIKSILLGFTPEETLVIMVGVCF